MLKGLPRHRLLLLMLLVIFSPQTEAKPAKTLDLVDTVTTNRILTKMALVLQGADLATFLSSKGPFTLFAPTDAAFAKLPPGMLDELLRPENKERLQHILLFHVVNGKKLTAKDLLTASGLISCEGAPLPVKTTKSGAQLVLKAKIVHADIRCQNGIIHEIDTVLMPPESSLPPLAPPAPPPAPATNALINPATAPLAPSDSSASGKANAVPVAPLAPMAAPEASPH